MLARAIIFGTSFLAGSAIADSVLEARNIKTANITVATDGGNLTFATVTRVANATYAYNVTEAFPTATAVAVEGWSNNTLAPMNTSTACLCPIPVTIIATEPTLANITVTVLPTAAASNDANITVTVLPTAAAGNDANITVTVLPTAAASNDANITVTVLPTAAATNDGTACPCQVVGTNQTILPTTQSVGASTAGETGAQSNNLLLNTNSGIMEIASIQLAAISIFFGLVGAGVTLL